MSALAMLVLAIAIGVLFSQSVPTPLIDEAQRNNNVNPNGEAKSMQVAPLPPIENLISHSVEGEPIATTSLADKYAQVQQELTLPPDLSAMDFSARSDDADDTDESGKLLNNGAVSENSQTKEENGQISQESNSSHTPATEKNQTEFDDILASASADSSAQNVPHDAKTNDITVAKSATNAPDGVDVSSNVERAASSIPQESEKEQSQKENAYTLDSKEAIPKTDTLEDDALMAANSQKENLPLANTPENTPEDKAQEATHKTSSTNTSNSSVKIPKLKANALVTSSSLEATASANVITKATLSMDGDQVQLLLVGSHALHGASFILDNPDRIVFDISGIWKMTVPRLISNRMVRDLRLGQTNSKTRLVFDMRVVPKSSEVLQISDNEIVLIFK